MHRSKLDIGSADAGVGGMSISSGSGASGMGASSSSFDASARGLRERAPARCAWRRAHRGRGVPRLPSQHRGNCRRCGHASHANQSSTPGFIAEVRDCASRPFGRRLAPPCFVHGQAFEGAVEDGAGKSGARLRLDAALEAVEDGHVAWLQVQRASWWEEAQHDVRERRPHGSQSGGSTNYSKVKKSQRQIGQVSALVQGSPDAERRMLRQCARCGLPTATLGIVQRRQSLARTVSAHVQLKLPLFFSTGLWRLHESLQILGLMCHVLELTLLVFVSVVTGGTLT